jgi:hypothetical protein
MKMAWCPAFKAGSTNWKQFFCKRYKPEVFYEYLEVTYESYCPLDVLLSFKIPILPRPSRVPNRTKSKDKPQSGDPDAAEKENEKEDGVTRNTLAIKSKCCVAAWRDWRHEIPERTTPVRAPR